MRGESQLPYFSSPSIATKIEARISKAKDQKSLLRLVLKISLILRSIFQSDRVSEKPYLAKRPLES